MRYLVQPEFRKSSISREIYGNFAEHLGRCIYDGVYVGEDSPVSYTHLDVYKRQAQGCFLCA